MNDVFTKNVSKEEARRALIVYPTTLINNNRLVEKVEAIVNAPNNKTRRLVMKDKPNNLGTLHLRALNNGKEIVMTKYAMNMLNGQLKRLHNQKLVHSNLGASVTTGTKNIFHKGHPYHHFERQVLVNYNENNKKIEITKAFLTNFNANKSGSTIGQEKTRIGQVLAQYDNSIELNNAEKVKELERRAQSVSIQNRTPPGTPGTPRTPNSTPKRTNRPNATPTPQKKPRKLSF